jgi:rod shape-determining protein MreD
VRRTLVIAVVLAAVLLQVVLARYTVGGRWAFDLVLVAVVFVALRWGIVAGMLAGTLGGLLLDLLSGVVIGVGGLSKTLIGTAAGAVGASFVVARPNARVLIVTAATVVHRALVLGLTGLIDQRWPVVPWTAMLEETVLNSLAALVVFHAAESVPEALARGRARRRAWRGRPRW